MRAICFIQETKDSDLTQRQQQLICHRALRKLLWPCVWELFAQAGTEEQPISLLMVGVIAADLAAARHGGSDARRRGRRGGCADRHRHPAPALQPRRTGRAAHVAAAIRCSYLWRERRPVDRAGRTALDGAAGV